MKAFLPNDIRVLKAIQKLKKQRNDYYSMLVDLSDLLNTAIIKREIKDTKIIHQLQKAIVRVNKKLKNAQEEMTDIEKEFLNLGIPINAILP